MSGLRVDTIAAEWCGQQYEADSQGKIVETLHIRTFVSYSSSLNSPDLA